MVKEGTYSEAKDGFKNGLKMLPNTLNPLTIVEPQTVKIFFFLPYTGCVKKFLYGRNKYLHTLKQKVLEENHNL